MPFFSDAPSELLPFVRVDSFTFFGPDSTTTNFSELPSISHNIVTGGIAFKPLDNIIFKADYRMTRIEGRPEFKQFNLGGGYAF